MTTGDIRDLDARAVRASVDAVEGITAVDLSRPTPCSEWTLGDLLAHMTAQHRGFTAASAGRGADPAVWKAGAPSPRPRGRLRDGGRVGHRRVCASPACWSEASRSLRSCQGWSSRLRRRSASTSSTTWYTAGTWRERSVSPTNSTPTWSRRQSPWQRPFPRENAGCVQEPRSDQVWPRQTTPARWTGSSPCSAATPAWTPPQ